jgi:hypothetical protein
MNLVLTNYEKSIYFPKFQLSNVKLRHWKNDIIRLYKQ